MNITSDPVRTHNLTAWFVLASAPPVACPDYVTLEEAMTHCDRLLHETGDVNNLLVENPTDRDLFIQAGDIVKGGRQDRTLGVDFIVPAGSGKVPVPAFCVESGRWHRRGAEPVAAFSESKHTASSKKLRAAMHLKKSQGAVWQAIAEDQAVLSAAVGASVAEAVSPTSLNLSYEHTEISKCLDDYLAELPKDPPTGTLGIAWAINNRVSHADLYASPALFQKFWKKLCRAACLEALAETQHPCQPATPATELTPDSIARWLESGPDGRTHTEILPPRTRVTTHIGPGHLRTETHDTTSAPVIHLSLMANETGL